jgi:hypothetical protein
MLRSLSPLGNETIYEIRIWTKMLSHQLLCPADPLHARGHMQLTIF